MAFSDVALLAADTDFANRVRACCAVEGFADPNAWQNDHVWPMAATPSFGDKYASGIANGIERPGNDQSVIADGEILAAVQAIDNAEAPDAS